MYVIRHADKNRETGELTEEGRERAKKLKHSFGTFDLVITSDRSRLTETALLLTGTEAQLDERAGFVYSSTEQKEKVRALAKVHPMNHAGVIFEKPEYKEFAETIGKNLIALIKETINKLPKDGKALLVSQDGVMVAAEHLLHNKPYAKLETSYLPLEGFIINENLETEENI